MNHPLEHFIKVGKSTYYFYQCYVFETNKSILNIKVYIIFINVMFLKLINSFKTSNSLIFSGKWHVTIFLISLSHMTWRWIFYFALFNHLSLKWVNFLFFPILITFFFQINRIFFPSKLWFIFKLIET
jgi:hypothetical protein